MAVQNGSNIVLPLSVTQGGTGQTTKTEGFDALAPTSNKGQTIVHNGTDNIALNAGTNGQVLTADSTQIAGVKWANNTPVTFDSIAPTVVKGDIPVHNGLTNTRLGIGGDGEFLIASSTQPTGMYWGPPPVTGVHSVANTDGKLTVTGTPADPILNISASFLASISQGGTGQTTKAGAFDALSPNALKGDLIAYDGLANTRLALGTNGQVLTADSTQSSGVKWAPAPAGGVTSVTAGTGITSSGGTTPTIAIDSAYVTPIASGGTAASTFNANGVVTGGTTATGALSSVATSATAGAVLTNVVSGKPVWTATLPVANGGTGRGSWGNYSIVLSNVDGSALTYASSTVAGQILISGTNTVSPSWSSITTNGFNCLLLSGASSGGPISSVGTQSANYILVSNGINAAPTFKNINAAKADQITATATTLYVTPSVQQFHASAAKAWCRFTVSGAVATLQASYNVTSITRSSVGSFLINFTTAFTTANYVSQCSAMAADNTAGLQPVIGFRNINVGSIGINSVTVDTATFTDFIEYYFVAYGTQ